jgi:hypothetical protein
MINLLHKIKNTTDNSDNSDNSDITVITTNCNSKKIIIRVIKDALEDNIYNTLNNEYLSIKDIFLLDKRNNPFLNPNKMMINNFIYSIDARRELNNNIITNDWKSFINHHLSTDFYDQFFILTKNYKNIKNIKNIKNVVSINKETSSFLNLKCISPITYFTKNLNIKEIDVNHLVLGLYFFKKENDTSFGGNLTIFKKIIKTSFINKQNQENQENEQEIITEEIKENIISIPYEKNRLIIISFENIIPNINQINQNDNIKLYYEFEPRNITFHSQRYIEFGLKN